MKRADLVVGGIYHDGKDGVREVLSIGPGLHDATVERVEYRVLAAKVTQYFSNETKEMCQSVGSTASCNVSSFQTWAKSDLSREECKSLLMRLEARKIKLAPGEKAFMDAALAEAEGNLSAGLRIEFDHMEGRAVSGLAKKGLLIRDDKSGEAEFTPLGATWASQART